MDYKREYDEYWSRSDRWGSHSFASGDLLAEQILSVCGRGKTLDVGFGMGLLVRTLVGKGVDAHGIDIAQKPVDEANKTLPGRFKVGSILSIPFPDNTFDTVVSTDCLEHIAEEDVPKALAELCRVTRRAAFVRLATTPDRDGRWHLTVRDRTWWELRLFEAGFRKHPCAQKVVPYEALETEDWQVTFILEKIPPAALEKYPLAALREERDLHMDMLREPGRRSDAHVGRYMLAKKYAPQSGVILDAACGLGYGSAALAENPGVRVIGMDASDYAVDYAKQNFCPGRGNLEFRTGDACNLSWLADGSVDLVVSFETVEHLKEPELFLAEVRRILKPGGVFLGSVPNMWVDETGKDPNPWHFHVFDFPKFASLCAKFFLLQDVFRQTAGGGMKLPDAPRRLRRVNLPVTSGHDRAEWWLIAAAKPITMKPSVKPEPQFLAVLAPDIKHPLYDSWLPHCDLPVKHYSNPDSSFEIPDDTAILVTHDNYNEPTRSIIRKAVEKNIPTLILADGILEYRNTFEHPGIIPGAILQPVMGHKIAALGRSQARFLDSWGNEAKSELVGSPRFDRFATLQKRQRSANEPFRVLITTALTPYFNEEQHAAVRASLSDLKRFFETRRSLCGVELEPVWRLTKGLEAELSIPVRGDVLSKDLVTLLQEVDAVISTPSTCLLEGMLLGLPTAVLDYCNTPHYVQPAWRITAESQIAAAVTELINPPEPKMLFQETTLHDSLECTTPATARLLQLIKEMVTIGNEARQANLPLQFAPNLLKSSRLEVHPTENRFQLENLFPSQAVLSDDVIKMQEELRQARRAAFDAQALLENEKKTQSAQVFFHKAGQFNENDSLRLRYPVGKWRRLNFSGCHGKIRIDPAERSGVVNIAGICVRSERTGKIVWFARSKQTFDTLPVGAEGRRMPDERVLKIFCFGNDPQMLLPELPGVSDTEPLRVTIWIKAETNFESVARFLTH